jgi:hypothetical protein
MAYIELKHSLQLENGRWRLKMWTAKAVDMSEKVFVYQKMPDLPYQQPDLAYFVNIASAADMADYPEDAAGPDFPFFRKNGADLSFASLVMAEQAAESAAGDAGALARTVTKLDVYI